MPIIVTFTLAGGSMTPLRAKTAIRDGFPDQHMDNPIGEIRSDGPHIAFSLPQQRCLETAQIKWLQEQDFVQIWDWMPGTFEEHDKQFRVQDEQQTEATPANQLTLNGPQARTIGDLLTRKLHLATDNTEEQAVLYRRIHPAYPEGQYIATVASYDGTLTLQYIQSYDNTLHEVRYPSDIMDDLLAFLLQQRIARMEREAEMAKLQSELDDLEPHPF